MVHVWCYGENIEGGKKKCALCVNPQGLSTQLLDPPPAPFWYTCPPQYEILITSSLFDISFIDDNKNSQGWLTPKKVPVSGKSSQIFRREPKNVSKMFKENTSENSTSDPSGGKYKLVPPAKK